MSTRRTFLRGLAALPVATIPVAALASSEPDAALIAAARRARALAIMEERAVNRRCDAEERFDAVKPVAPADCRAEISASYRTIMDECPTPLTLADNEILKVYMQRAGTAAGVIRRRHDAAMARYETEHERLRQETGLTRAENLAEWLTDRLEAAVDHLADMPATTSAGLKAKAEVWVEISKGSWGQGAAPWHDRLAGSIVREVLAIGGDA